MVQGKRTNILVPSHTPSPVGLHVVKCKKETEKDKKDKKGQGETRRTNKKDKEGHKDKVRTITKLGTKTREWSAVSHLKCTLPQSSVIFVSSVFSVACLPPAPIPFSTACYCDWCLLMPCMDCLPSGPGCSKAD